ncbi:unnamed protein product [Mytilus edulis]|uniref:AIG1-type G domain-containing protein n=1 Tax=Mytilus edulis TaxID=6550 RepID=A0A8S3SZK2_MYTED|nr:unnamed protein product [Mytilus edulis]
MTRCDDLKKEFQCSNFVFDHDSPKLFVLAECGPRILYPIWSGFWLVWHIVWFSLDPYNAYRNGGDEESCSSQSGTVADSEIRHCSQKKSEDIDGSDLRWLLNRTEYRYTAFGYGGNRADREAEVIELLEMVDNLVKENDGKYYTNYMYKRNEKLLKERWEEEKQKETEKLETEIQSAKKSVQNEFEEKQKELEKNFEDQKIEHENNMKILNAKFNEQESDIEKIKDKNKQDLDEMRRNIEQREMALTVRGIEAERDIEKGCEKKLKENCLIKKRRFERNTDLILAFLAGSHGSRSCCRRCKEFLWKIFFKVYQSHLFVSEMIYLKGTLFFKTGIPSTN